MPRGKRTKKSGPAAVTKGHAKSVFDTGVVGSAAGGGFGGNDHVNGLVLKRELLNGEATNHHHFENEHNLERAIDELINGNVEDHQSAEYLDDRLPSSSSAPSTNNNFSTGPRPAVASAAAASSAAASPQLASAASDASYRGANGSAVKNEPYSDSHFHPHLSNSDQHNFCPKAEPGCNFDPTTNGTFGGSAATRSSGGGGGGGGGSAEDPEDLLCAELASADTQGSLQGILPGSGGNRLVNGSVVGAGSIPSMQQRAPGSAVVGSGGGNGTAAAAGTGRGNGVGVGGVVGERVRDMPAHWQLTPVGRGRVAPGNNGSADDKTRDQRLSPAPPERIPTGFNERPIGDGEYTLYIINPTTAVFKLSIPAAFKLMPAPHPKGGRCMRKLH